MPQHTSMSILLLAGTLLGGCATTSTSTTHRISPYESLNDAERNPLLAQQLTMQAAQIIHDDPDRAEQLLRDALAADLFHGPAHNNLGVIHLERGRLYEAANEFEWARKLMPGHPDPRVNLALTLERAGRVDEALAAYDSALEVYPDDLAAMQGLVRLQLLTKRPDDRTPRFLNEVAIRSDDSVWREWARGALRQLH